MFRFKFILLLACFSIAQSNFPYDPDIDYSWRSEGASLGYRLPEVLDPEHYDVEVTPYFEATANRDAFTFDGIVSITVRVSNLCT